MKSTILWKYFVNPGLSSEEYSKISGELHKNNKQNLMIFSAIASVFLFIMFLLSFAAKELQSIRWLYFFTLLVTLAVHITSTLCSETRPGLLLIDIYAFTGILFIFGSALGTVVKPDQQTVTFIALLLTVPLLFTDRPIRMVGCIYVYIIAFTITAVHIKYSHLITVDIINACVFGNISAIVSTYMMSVKCQRYLYEQQVAIMSEIDFLTGTRNRNAYEQSLSKYPLFCKNSGSCIFADVNGLHELNNTKGHEAGDKMLRFVSEKLMELFGKNDTYRIGGDEFVVLVKDCSSDEILNKIDLLMKAVEEENYHLSIGYDTAFGFETDMDTLITNAEKHMYEAKKQFYQQKGIDRNIRV